MTIHNQATRLKLMEPVGTEIQQKIYTQFPELNAIGENHAHSMGRAAISIFDHWLRDENEWPLLDCFEGAERRSRDRKFLAHWASIFDLTPVYTLRYRGRGPRKAKPVIKKYLDKTGFLNQCRFKPTSAPSQLVVLPEFDCIYAASWDDTNVLYFNSRERAKPIIDLAINAGLFCIEFDR